MSPLNFAWTFSQFKCVLLTGIGQCVTVSDVGFSQLISNGREMEFCY